MAKLTDLAGYPLLSAIAERRSRRVARGTSVLSRGLDYESRNRPEPLSELEEAILIVSTGLTGITTHDGPLDSTTHGRELGTPFLNILARSGSSPDNSQPTHFIVVNDEGTWLIKRLPPAEGLALLKNLPTRWSDWNEADWLGAARAVKHRLRPDRLDFPRAFPYYLGWNKQLSNVAGTTMFLPLVDTTRMYINALLNICSEPDGQRPLFLDDWQPFRPRNAMDWIGWLAGRLHLAPAIPYQPIGGVKRARSGFVNPNIPIPIGLVRTFLSDHESFFLSQNLMLLAQAMGLGAWIHVSTPSAYLFDGQGGKVGAGLGFRMHTPEKKWGRWPPLPANQPNPVGIDGVLEGLCPPYVSVDEAVDRILEQKYAAQGAYGNSAIFDRSYQNARDGKTFLQEGERYSAGAIEYTREVCHYIYDTYGRFPAHVDAFYQPGTWLQVCHVELEFYQRFFDPRLYERQARHQRDWHE
jgi:nitroreductase